MNRKEFLQELTVSFSGIYIKNDFTQCEIHTRRICELCKYKLGRNIYFERGVKSVEIDVLKNTIVISYDPTKTTSEKIKKYIASIGYDADELKGNIRKREILRDCCETDMTICK